MRKSSSFQTCNSKKIGTHTKYVDNQQYLGRIRLASPLFMVSTPSILEHFRIDSYQMMVETSQNWQTFQEAVPEQLKSIESETAYKWEISDSENI